MNNEISTEINRQLKLVKKQIDIELAQDIEKLYKNIDTKINRIIDEKIRELNKNIRETIRENIRENSKENDKELAIVKLEGQLTTYVNEQINLTVDKMGSVIYNKVRSDINTKITPKLDNLAKYVAYNNQDFGETIKTYRTTVAKSDLPD